MSKSNIEKVIEKILFDDQALSKFLVCKDQNDLYNYCLNKGSGYTREEFDEFVEETIVKANKEKEVVASSLKDVGGSQASHGISKKIRQAFTKALAAGLAVFSAVPMVQNLMPEVEATSVSETVEDVKTVGFAKRKENSEESGSLDEEKDASRSNVKRNDKTKEKGKSENKVIAKKQSFNKNKIMPWFLRIGATAAITYGFYRVIKHLLLDSSDDVKPEKNESTELLDSSDIKLIKPNVSSEKKIGAESITSVPITSKKPSAPPSDESDLATDSNISAAKLFFTEERLRKFLDEHLPDTVDDDGTKISVPNASQTHISFQEATEIFQKAVPIFENVPKVVDIEGPTTVTSDFHGAAGEARDCIRDWLVKLGTSEETHFLCLGDYQDRSDWGMETFLALVILKCTFPEKVTLLRGNHDIGVENDIWDEFCIQPIGNYKYSLGIGDEDKLKDSGFCGAYKDIAEQLSLVAELYVGSKKILCTHAAVPQNYDKDSYLNLSQRFPTPNPDNNGKCFYSRHMIGDILWGDYREQTYGGGIVEAIDDTIFHGRGMSIGINSYKKTMEAAGFDFAVSGHEHRNVSLMETTGFPLFKVCSQPYRGKSAEMLIISKNESSDVTFSRKRYNPSEQKWE